MGERVQRKSGLERTKNAIEVAILARQRDGMSQVRIIIVDDHEVVRAGLRACLSGTAGLAVVGEACNASETFVIIETTHPDLVVLDLGLPDKNGLQVTAEIRAAWPGIKVVVLTGSEGESTVKKAIQAGADGFIRKEEAASELLRAIPIVMAGQSYLSPFAAAAITRELRLPAEANSAPESPRPTERELEVLRGFAEGLTYKEIAALMQVSVRTVETYRARLIRRFGCKTRAELVRYAVRHGMVKP